MEGTLPLVLSHGVIESSSSWAGVVPLLEVRFNVIAHDARGRGSAPVPAAAFGYADLAEDVQQLADRMGLERFHHAGHSMGGRIALEHALAHPDRVVALAVVSARAEAPDEAGRRRLRALAAEVRRSGPEAAIEMWTQPGDRYYERVRQISSGNSSLGTAAALEALAEMDSLVPRLAEVHAPTLVVVGDRDPAYVRSAQLMVEALPRARLRILKGAGHFPNLECPEELGRLLVDFFEGAVHDG